MQDNNPEFKEIQRRYLANPGFCPFCQSPQIQGSDFEVAGSECTQEMTCLECEAQWYDVYELAGIRPR